MRCGRRDLELAGLRGPTSSLKAKMLAEAAAEGVPPLDCLLSVMGGARFHAAVSLTCSPSRGWGIGQYFHSGA
jgi:hypothetical protein